jgi:hypothetical protein
VLWEPPGETSINREFTHFPLTTLLVAPMPPNLEYEGSRPLDLVYVQLTYLHIVTLNKRICFAGSRPPTSLLRSRQPGQWQEIAHYGHPVCTPRPQFRRFWSPGSRLICLSNWMVGRFGRSCTVACWLRHQRHPPQLAPRCNLLSQSASCNRTWTIRSAARPSQSFGTRPAFVFPARISRATPRILAGS